MLHDEEVGGKSGYRTSAAAARRPRLCAHVIRAPPRLCRGAPAG